MSHNYYPITPTIDSGYTSRLEAGGDILTARNYSSDGMFLSITEDLRVQGYSYAGSGGIYTNTRTFLNFDLSDESADGIVVSAVLQLTSGESSHSYLNNGHKFYVVEANTAGAISQADYPNLKDRPASGTYADIVPLYADSATAVSAVNTQYNIDLNGTAISHLNSEYGTSTKFDLALITEWDYTGDFTEGVDLNPSTPAGQGVEFHSKTSLTSSYRPLLILTMSTTTFDIKSAKVIIKSGQLIIK